jgi:large subunit ribosomal protein L30e
MSTVTVELVKAIQTLGKTGQYKIGFNQSRKLVMLGKAKAVVTAANAPPHVKRDLKYYAKLSNIPVIEFPGTNFELGALIGKPFGVSSMVIIDPGQSNILDLAREVSGNE